MSRILDRSPPHLLVGFVVPDPRPCPGRMRPTPVAGACVSPSRRYHPGPDLSDEACSPQPRAMARPFDGTHEPGATPSHRPCKPPRQPADLAATPGIVPPCADASHGAEGRMSGSITSRAIARCWRYVLQEMFGCQETPRIAGVNGARHGPPAHRPAGPQVTKDLASFWRSAYQDVKKELRGRYPRHHWPDDPFSAQPTNRTKRRT